MTIAVLRGSGSAEGQNGSAVVEFVLVLPVLFLVLLALVEIAVVARTQLDLIHASRVAAREAAATPEVARAVEAAVASLGRTLSENARISVRRPSVVGRRAEVEITLPYRAFSPLLGGISVELKARSVMRVER